MSSRRWVPTDERYSLGDGWRSGPDELEDSTGRKEEGAVGGRSDNQPEVVPFSVGLPVLVQRALSVAQAHC